MVGEGHSLAPHRRLWWLRISILILVALAPSVSLGQEPAKADLIVATKALEPFVFVSDSGEVSGFSVDVWSEIAKRLDITTTWEVRESVAELIDLATNEQVDASIAGISMTRAREEVIDFTHPYYDSGLLIATTGSGGESLGATLFGVVTSRNFLFPLVALLGLITLVAHAIWWVERTDNPEFPDAYRRGIGEALWWSSVSVVTGGEAVKDIRRPLSRILALLWMVVGLFLIAFVTAAAASALTVRQLEGSINSIEDLPGNAVLTVEATVADAFLTSENIGFDTVVTVDQALDALVRGDADAVVFDAPVLAYLASGDYRGQIVTVGQVFAPDPYSIALPPGSDLREPINSALLDMARDGTLDLIHERWFSVDRSGV